VAAKKPSKSPSTPFHVAAQQARSRAYVLESTIAGIAGITTALYRAMEQGAVPLTRPVYDALVAKFPSLSSYPAPGASPLLMTYGHHPAVMAEYERTKALRSLSKKLNIGTTNRQIVLDLLRMVARGDVTAEDCEEHI
jgi:hypothetical protein